MLLGSRGSSSDLGAIAEVSGVAVGGSQFDAAAGQVEGLALDEPADSLDWQVEVHVERGRLPEVLAQLQDVRTVIVDHFGKPDGIDDTATWAAVERDAGRLHVKLSAPYRLGGVDPAALVARWLERVGPGRLLWGSDWPCTNHEAAAPAAHLTAPLRAWLQDEAIVRRVLFETPLALYRFDPPPG